jgi:DNA-binding transcriptional ArsR family regulator
MAFASTRPAKPTMEEKENEASCPTATSPGKMNARRDDAVRAIKAMSDRTRLRILSALMEGEQCVKEIARQLGLAQPRISHHLTILRTSGLVWNRRHGQQIIYSVNPFYRATPSGGPPAIQVDRLRVEFPSAQTPRPIR